MVGIPRHLEERKLPGRLFGNKTPDHDKALSGFPSPRFVFELGKPKPRRDLLVRKTSEVSLDRLGDPCNNGIESRHFLKVLGNYMIVESRVGPYANLSNIGRQLGDAFFQNLDGVRSRMGIAGEVDPFPDIACFPLETEEGLIGRAPSLFGIEPHFGTLLLSIHRQHFGVEVEDDGRERIGSHQKTTSKSIVEVLESRQPS